MEDTQVQTAPTPVTADAPVSGTPPPIDMDKLTLPQVEALLRGESVEIPVESGGEGKTTDQVETPPATAAVETPKPGEEPAAAVETPVVTEEEVVETRTAEEVEAAVEAAKAAVVEAGGDEAAQEAAAAEAGKPVAAVVEPDAEPEDDDEPAAIERPRFKDRRQQLIIGVFKEAERAGHPITFAEAEARVDGPKDTAPVVVPPNLSEVVTTIEDEITVLKGKLAEYDDMVPTKESREIAEQLSDKKGELLLAKQNLRKASDDAKAKVEAERATSASNRDASHAQALQDYPDAAKKGTPLYKAIAERVAAIKNRAHPDHDILFADSAPLTVARIVAAELGILPVGKKPASPPVKPATPPLRQKVSPAPGNKTAVASVQPAEDVKAQMTKVLDPRDTSVSLTDLDAVQNAPTNPSELLAGAAR